MGLGARHGIDRVPTRLERWLGRRALAVAERLHRLPYAPLNYDSERSPAPRWGHGRPSHPGLRELLARHDDACRAALERVVAQREALARIPRERGAPGEPFWLNPWQPPLDAAALYAFVRDRAPARYVEVGAGVSTLFADRARRDGRLATRMTSIDPLPRDEVAGATDELLRARVEDTDLSAFAGLQAGDVILFDGSHRATMGSDVVVFHLEVLPALPPGVLVGVHDVMLPDDYLPELAEWRWSEQYLVAGLLLAGAPFVRPVLPAWHASTTPQLAAVVAPLFDDPRLAGMDRRGVALWLETVAS